MAEPTQEEVQRIVAGNEIAKGDTAYVNSIILDAEQIEGTRYRYILCNHNIYSEE